MLPNPWCQLHISVTGAVVKVHLIFYPHIFQWEMLFGLLSPIFPSFWIFFLTLWRWKCSHYRTSWRSRSPFGDQVKPSTLCIPVLEAKKSFVFFPITSFLSSHLCEILIKKNIFHYHLCFLEVEPLWNQLICKMGVCLVWSASGLLKTPVCCKFFTHVSL